MANQTGMDIIFSPERSDESTWGGGRRAASWAWRSAISLATAFRRVVLFLYHRDARGGPAYRHESS